MEAFEKSPANFLLPTTCLPGRIRAGGVNRNAEACRNAGRPRTDDRTRHADIPLCAGTELSIVEAGLKVEGAEFPDNDNTQAKRAPARIIKPKPEPVENPSMGRRRVPAVF